MSAKIRSDYSGVMILGLVDKSDLIILSHSFSFYEITKVFIYRNSIVIIMALIIIHPREEIHEVWCLFITTKLSYEKSSNKSITGQHKVDLGLHTKNLHMTDNVAELLLFDLFTIVKSNCDTREYVIRKIRI